MPKLRLSTKSLSRPAMAFSVARLAGVSVDDLLTGRFAPAGTCPHCGYASQPQES